MTIRSRISICCIQRYRPDGCSTSGTTTIARPGADPVSMAEQLTWTTLRELAGFRSEGGCAISLYLDLDTADSPTPTAVDTRVHSLLSAGREGGRGASRRALARRAGGAEAGLRPDPRVLRQRVQPGRRPRVRDVRVRRLLPAASGRRIRVGRREASAVPFGSRRLRSSSAATTVRSSPSSVASAARSSASKRGGSRRSSTERKISRDATTRAASRSRGTSGTSRSWSPST